MEMHSMKWEDKAEMIRLLNNRLYQEAVDLFSKEQNWDGQAVTMFVFGFDLTKCDLLEPIKERLCQVATEDFRTAMRLALIQEYFNEN